MYVAGTPIWLRVAAAALIIQDVIAAIFLPVTAFGIASLGITLLMAWFLLRGSRVAWVLAVLSVGAQLAASLTLGQPAWVAGVAVMILICLLASSSRSFVWVDKQERARDNPWRSVTRLRGRLLDLAYGLVAQMPLLGGIPPDEIEAADRPLRGKLIILLLACVVILYPLVGALYSFHHGSGSGSVVVDILWHIIWIVYKLVQLALVVLVVTAIYRYVTTSRKRVKV